MRTPPDYALGKDYSINKCHEPIVNQAVIDSINNINEPVFWDVGAASGYYSVLAAQIIEDSRDIHAFESDKTGLLEKNNIRYADENIVLNNNRVGSDPNKEIILDDYYQNNGCPDIIKIDVDGEEKNVLSGMRQLVKCCTPVILIEIHFFNQNYTELIEFLSKFFDSKYRFKICTDHRNIAAEWHDINSIDELPEEDSKENFPDPDYMLLCYPNHTPVY